MRYTRVDHNLESASAALESLAASSPKRNLAEELSALKPTIKAALNAGHKPAAIARTLKSSGVSASLQSISLYVGSLVPKTRKPKKDEPVTVTSSDEGAA